LKPGCGFAFWPGRQSGAADTTGAKKAPSVIAAKDAITTFFHLRSCPLSVAGKTILKRGDDLSSSAQAVGPHSSQYEGASLRPHTIKRTRTTNAASATPAAPIATYAQTVTAPILRFSTYKPSASSCGCTFDGWCDAGASSAARQQDLSGGCSHDLISQPE
jgi:hypothetical protein